MPGVINYTKLPEGLRGGAQRWIENGIVPGSFLTAVIRNDLTESFAQADDMNIKRMFDIVSFFYNEAPSQCWGSREKMIAWRDMHEERRRVREEKKLKEIRP